MCRNGARAGSGVYFAWKRAHAARVAGRALGDDAAPSAPSGGDRAHLRGIHARILERGRHLGPDDAERVEAIKRARPVPEPRRAVTPPPSRSDEPAAAPAGRGGRWLTGHLGSGERVAAMEVALKGERLPTTAQINLTRNISVSWS